MLVGVLMVWPGYVYWARGQAKLAAVAFKLAIDQIEYRKTLFFVD